MSHRIDDAIVGRIYELLGEGQNPAEVARALGVSRSTVANYRRKGGIPTSDASKMIGDPAAIERYRSAGPAPTDSLALVEYAQKLLGIQLELTVVNPRLDERTRGREIVQLSREIVRTVPNSRLAAAERAVRRDEALLEGTADEELSDAPKATARAVRGENRSGRPSRRPRVH